MTSYIYSTAKNRRSGTAMQKSALRGSALRRRQKEPLPGFPRLTPFSTEQQVLDYIAGDELECLICGKLCTSIPHHVRSAHDMDAADYRQRFGIPAGASLIGKALREKRAADAHRENNIVLLREMRAQKPWERDRSKERHAPYVAATKAVMAARVRGTRKPIPLEAFEWHLARCADTWHCWQLHVPDGLPSWSTFEKRCKTIPEMRAKFRAARETERRARNLNRT